jgi:molybdopterin-containing oxidoreductase family iron-sulfur binding subunit
MGATGAFEQASVLNLYDPDRSKVVLNEGRDSSWAAFRDDVLGMPRSSRILVVASPTSSLTEAGLKADLERKFAAVDWVSYSPAGDHADLEGSQLAFGGPFRPSYEFASASIIVGLDADFLGNGASNQVANARGYAESRRVESSDDTMSRLYVAESTFTVTGGMADHRLSIRSSHVAAIARALAAELGVGGSAPTLENQEQAWVDAVAADLRANRGRSVILAGRDQPAAVHAVCALLNARLGNVGSTVRYFEPQRLELTTSDLSSAVSRMKSGNYDVVICLETNPVYSAPASIDFASALAAVGTSVHLGSHVDETAAVSTWHVPAAHYLEAWGDGRAHDGTIGVIQPLIAPLYADAKSRIELLSALSSSGVSTGFELVQATMRDRLSGPFEDHWRKVVHDGFVEGSAARPVDVQATTQVDELLAFLSAAATSDRGLEVVVRPDGKLYDGLFSNNAWMQELPDSIHKITWDNVAVMGPETAQRLGVEVRLEEGQHFADLVTLTVDGRSVELPVWVVPGQAEGSISVTMGYGRNILSDRSPTGGPFFDLDVDVYSEGALANGVGTNVSPLLPAGGFRIVTGVSVEKSGEDYMIASTQDHPSMEGRPMVRMATVDEFKANPAFAQEAVPPLEGLEPWDEYPSLWEDNHPKNQPEFTTSLYNKNQWGMAVDLNACTGCNACVVACTSENNVQVVGKESISHGREMSWIRLDRYFTGEDLQNAGMVVQPMMCQHCENAPCESVCPVAATVHSSDGLNVMVYNRCIGTRYCANNCPYKVRRFNFFNWTKTIPTQVQMAQNPNVTVRFRGVMEKCTFCVQRIREAGITARQESRDIADGEVKTACQQACPSNAITFGNIADSESEVTRKKASPRSYELLAELSIKPRTSYLARLRNPNPALEETEA